MNFDSTNKHFHCIFNIYKYRIYAYIELIKHFLLFILEFNL